MTSPSRQTESALALRLRCEELTRRAEELLATSSDALGEAERLLLETLNAGRTVFTCGNGGSAAHAAHLEAELVGRYRRERPGVRSICLGLSAATATAVANDYGADEVFARPLRTLATAGDLLVAFTTSGRSPNVLSALEVARSLGVGTILVSGPRAPDAADVVLRFPGERPDQIQDGHGLILHALMDAVDPGLRGA